MSETHEENGEAAGEWTARSGSGGEEDDGEGSGRDALALDSERSGRDECVESDGDDDEVRTSGELHEDEGEVSMDSLPSALATGRTGVDELLDAMFTDRTVDTSRSDDDAGDRNGEREDETEGKERDRGDGSERGDQSEEGQGVNNDDNLAQVEEATRSSRTAALTTTREANTSMPVEQSKNVPIDATPSATSMTRKSLAKSSACPSSKSPSSKFSNTRGDPTLRIIAFDVGGSLFRCKESLIRKYPLKKLNQVISCGCEQVARDTFFIDRNPQNFEVILDWYRTGTYVRHPHVNEDALREDAKYFDLYHELFPDNERTSAKPPPIGLPGDERNLAASQPPRVPDRPHRQTTQAKPARNDSTLHIGETPVPRSRTSYLDTPSPLTSPLSPVSAGHEGEFHHHDHDQPAKIHKHSDAIVRFCKNELRIVELDGIPVVYMVRKHEQLLVASVKGHGKLLVRVCDATGVQVVHVQSAVLFDSQSHFYLQGGRAKLQHCLLPGNYTYTFWMEVVHDREVTANEKENSCGKSGSLKDLLEVEFKLMSSFRKDEELTDSLDDELQSLAGSGGGGFAEVFTPPGGAKASTDSEKNQGPSFSPFMFLPPRLQQARYQSLPQQHPNDTPSWPRQEEKQQHFESTSQHSSVYSSNARSDRDAIAKQLFATSPSTQNASSVAKESTADLQKSSLSNAKASVSAAKKASKAGDMLHAQPSAIQRNGAAIVLGKARRSHNTSNNDVAASAGTITVYKHAELRIEDSQRDSPAKSPKKMMQMTKEATSPVVAKYQDHQPRLFR